MRSQLISEQRVDANAEGGLTEAGEGLLQMVGSLVFVESTEIELTRPVEVYLQYEGAYGHWVASFCRAAVSAAGETPREAIDELRRLLVFIHETWITEKELPEPWRWLPPKMLRVLEEHFARRSVDV